LPQQPAPREHLPRQNRRWGYFPTHAAASALVPLLAVEVASSTQRGPRSNDVVVLGVVSSSNQAKGPRLQKRPPVGTAWCHFLCAFSQCLSMTHDQGEATASRHARGWGSFEPGAISHGVVAMDLPGRREIGSRCFLGGEGSWAPNQIEAALPQTPSPR
jgi:hypothetical protein